MYVFTFSKKINIIFYFLPFTHQSSTSHAPLKSHHSHTIPYHVIGTYHQTFEKRYFFNINLLKRCQTSFLKSKLDGIRKKYVSSNNYQLKNKSSSLYPLPVPVKFSIICAKPCIVIVQIIFYSVSASRNVLYLLRARAYHSHRFQS